MFNLYPGQGLGSTASREIALGLGTSTTILGIVDFSADIGVFSNLINVNLRIPYIIDSVSIYNQTVILFTTSIQAVSSLTNIDVLLQRLFTANVNLDSNLTNIDFSNLPDGIINIIESDFDQISIEYLANMISIVYQTDKNSIEYQMASFFLKRELESQTARKLLC